MTKRERLEDLIKLALKNKKDNECWSICYNQLCSQCVLNETNNCEILLEELVDILQEEE